MVQIEMTSDEARMLHKILESHLSELRIEMAGTRVDDLEEPLRREEEIIAELLKRLPVEKYPESMFGEYA